MNILFLSHRVPFPPNKGEKIRTYHQIKYLAELGHQVAVLAPFENTKDKEDLTALANKHCSDTYGTPIHSQLAMIKGLLLGQPLSVAAFYHRKLQKKLDHKLENEVIDTIICSSSSMAHYIFKSKVLSKLSPDKKPTLIMDFMDLDSDKWKQYTRIKPFPLNLIYQREAKLIQKLESEVHSKFDHCLFISNSEISLFLESNKNLGKLHAIGNGINTQEFKPSTTAKPAEGPVILFTGVMDYLPNEDAVIWFVEEGWNHLKTLYPNARFYIAGMNPSSKVKALESYEGVTVTGFVDNIHTYFDKAHYFIAPFRLSRGVQNKVLQAFACGLPTITTPSGIEGIECKPGTHVVVKNTIMEMVSCIDQLEKNNEKKHSLGQNAAKLILETYSWESMLSPLKKLI